MIHMYCCTNFEISQLKLLKIQTDIEKAAIYGMTYTIYIRIDIDWMHLDDV